MKRKIIRVILFVSTVVTAIYLLARFLPVPKTVNSNEWFLLTRVNDIVRKYSYVTSDSELMRRGDSIDQGPSPPVTVTQDEFAALYHSI